MNSEWETVQKERETGGDKHDMVIKRKVDVKNRAFKPEKINNIWRHPETKYISFAQMDPRAKQNS